MSEAASLLCGLGPADSEGTAALNEVRDSVVRYLRASERNPGNAQFLYVLISDLVGRSAIGGTSGRLAQALMTGVRRREELLRANGGVESSGAAARRLTMSKQAVLVRANRGALLGLRTLKQNAVLFPVFQFATDNAGLVRGLKEVLEVLNEQPALDGWAKCNFLLSPRDSLGGKTPLALLRDGHTRRVVNLARVYAQS